MPRRRSASGSADGSGTMPPSIGITCSGCVPHVIIGPTPPTSITCSTSNTASSSDRQLPPRRDGVVEQLAARRHRPAGEVLVGGVVRGDHADLGAHLDRHVAERQARFDRQDAHRWHRPTRRRGPRPAATPNVADRVEDHESLAVTLGAGCSVEPHSHRLRTLLADGLGGEHVRRLAGADAPGERPQPAVRAGVAVGAHDQHPGLGDAELGADDVDDALAGLADVEHLDAGRRAAPPHVAQQDAAGRIGVGGAPGRCEMA